jgi:hypothetical protein
VVIYCSTVPKRIFPKNEEKELKKQTMKDGNKKKTGGLKETSGPK